MKVEFKKVVSSVIEVKDLFNNLNQDDKDYIDNARKALKTLEKLTDDERSEVMKDICVKYKYFDAKDAIKMENDINVSKPVIKLLLNLDKSNKSYSKNLKLVLKKVYELTGTQINLILKNKVANEKLSEAKVDCVGNEFIKLDDTLGVYTSNANKALNMHNNLFLDEKVLFENNKKYKDAYFKAILNSTKSLLMKFDLENKDYDLIGSEALFKYSLLPKAHKESIENNLFYKRKLDIVNYTFDKIKANELIEKLHTLYLASIQTNLTSEYFTYALKLISEFEGLTDGAKKLVETQAAFELQVAKIGKKAHPVVYLVESYLPNKNHSKYYEIADILIAAYDFALTDIERRYVNKSIDTIELLDKAREDISIQEYVI